MIKAFLVTLLLFLPISAYPEDMENTNKAIEWIMKSCVSSGSKITIEGTGNLNLKLKSLKNIGAEGSFNIKKDQIEGLTDKLNQLSFDNANKIRDCIAPFREKIFHLYIDENKNLETWAGVEKRFRDLMHDRKYKRANELTGKLATLATKEFGMNSHQSKKSVGYAAASNIFMGNYNKAIQQLKIVVDLNSISFTSKESLLADIDNTLHMIAAYNAKGNLKKSRKYLDHAYSLKKIFGPTVRPHEMLSVALIEGTRASVLISEGKFDEGIKAAEECYEMLDEIPNGKDGTLYGVYEQNKMESIIEAAKMAKRASRK